MVVLAYGLTAGILENKMIEKFAFVLAFLLFPRVEQGFKIKTQMISNVTGKFTQFDAEAETEGDYFTNARVVENIAAASINTAKEQRDEHLRNTGFSGMEPYPDMKPVSTKVERVDDGTLTNTAA
jgi:polyisoprenoid-binding protein YceI